MQPQSLPDIDKGCFKRYSLLVAASICACLLLLSLPILLVQVGPIAPDSAWYTMVGLNVARGKGITDSAGELFLIRLPFYPLILGIAFWLFGPSLSTALLVTKTFAVFTLFVILLLGKRLFNTYVGLIGVALVASSAYLNQIPTRLLLDGVHAFFMLITLYLVVIGFERQQRRFFLLAGLCLGAAIWVKQTATLFLPLPLLLFLLIDRYRAQRWWTLKSLLAYWFVAIAVVAAWWGYTFFKTGQVYLITDKGYDLTSPPIIFIAVGVSLGLALYFWPERWLLQGQLLYITTWGANNKKGAFILRFAPVTTAIILLLAFLLFSWKGLNRPFSEILNHASFIPEYFSEHIISGIRAQPLLRFAPWAWLFVIFMAVRGRKDDRIILLAGLLYLPILLLISMPLPVNWGPRHLLVLYLLSYLAIARTIVYVVELIPTFLNRLTAQKSWVRLPYSFFFFSTLLKQRNIWSGSLVFIVILYSLTQSFQFLQVQNSKDPLDNCGWHSQPVFDLSHWLATSVPANTPVMSTWMFSWSLYFLTGGQYPVYTLPTDWSSRIVMMGDMPRLINTRHSGPVSTVLYWRKGLGGDIYPYTTVLEIDLIKEIVEKKVEYLLITSGEHPFIFRAVPSYFLDNPAFQEVFHIEGKCGEKIHVFRVDHSRLTSRNGPLIVNSDLIFELFRDSDKNEQDSWALFQHLGRNGVRIEPENRQTAEAYIILGDVYRKRDHLQTALDFYKRAMIISPNLLPEEYHKIVIPIWQKQADRDALAATALGRLYVSKGALDQAINTFQKAVVLAPDDPQTYIYLAETYVQKGETSHRPDVYAEIAANYQKAFNVALDDSNVRDRLVEAYVTLGEEYFDKGMLDQLIEAYIEATQLTPNSFQVHWKLAQVYVSLGQLDQAIVVYNNIIARWPDRADAYLHLGQTYEAQSSVASAVSSYRKALHLQPSFVTAYIRLGKIYQAQGKLEEAVGLYETAAQHNSSAAWPHLQLGQIYLSQANSRRNILGYIDK